MSNYMEAKVTENRLRRKLARRHHYTLRRSRLRDPLAQDYGKYFVFDQHGQVVGAYLDLDAVAARWEDQ